MTCKHNNRTRYTNGFFCEDCENFFTKDSPEYRSDELLSSIWMALNNINANSAQKGGPPCGWKTAGHIQQGDYKKILDERWNEKSKTRIASIRYNLGVSIIANKLSAWEFYLERQMVA